MAAASYTAFFDAIAAQGRALSVAEAPTKRCIHNRCMSLMSFRCQCDDVVYSIGQVTGHHHIMFKLIPVFIPVLSQLFFIPLGNDLYISHLLCATWKETELHWKKQGVKFSQLSLRYMVSSLQ
jgi:hypothetical protein